MIDGVINVYKEAGYTSHDVVARLRGILKQKKIGHTGTLDPEATGVLPVCLGKGTKLCDMLTDKDKTYEAVLVLGTVTDTQDTSGTILSEAPAVFTDQEIEDVIYSFTGDYDQIPPMYSALKVNGKKLYELAREGKEVERKARRVCIHRIEIGEIRCECGQKIEVEMTVNCSKGTYIRTLCHDIGQKLGCGGCMAQLKRTQTGRFTIDTAKTLDEIQQLMEKTGLDSILIKVDETLMDYPAVTIREQQSKLLYNGNPFDIDGVETKTEEIVDRMQVRVYDHLEQFIGIYQYEQELGRFKTVKMFV